MKAIYSKYSYKLLILTLMISIIPILIFGVLMYLEKIDQEVSSIKHQMHMSSENKAHHISDWIIERKNDVKNIAKNTVVVKETKTIKNNFNKNELFNAKFSLEKQLNAAHQNHDWLEDLRISDSNTGDTIFFTGMSPPKYNLKYQDHFIEAVNGKTSSSDVYGSLEIIENEFGSYERGVPTLLISSPIIGEVGIEAILTARVNIFELTFKDHIEHTDPFVSLDSYMINSNGMLLSKPESTNELRDHYLIDERPELHLSLKNLILDEPFPDFKISNNLDLGWNEGYHNFLGEKVVGVSVPVAGTDWHIISEISHNEAFYGATFFQLVLLSLIGITLLSVSGISLFFSSKLTAPIKNLIKVTEQIKKGNLKVSIKSCGNDEIHDLAESVNSMANSLQKAKETKQAVLKKYHDIYENSPLLHRTINMEGIVTNCNKAYAETFGYSKYEVIGKSVFDFVPTNTKELLDKSFSDWKRTGQVNNREIIFKKKDGTTFPGLLSANNLYDEKGKRIGSNTIIVDITDVRQKENEIEDLKQKRLTAIGELTARIAHDMRNPLSVIKNSADIIKMSQPVDDHTLQNWERLERGIYRIKHQVEDVLDYVKSTPFKKEPTKLLLILQDALERIEIPDEVNVILPKENVEILCDHEKIETVFVNLIMNAIQALEKNPGQITIAVEKISLDYAKIKVEDSGPGIPEHLIPKIFDPLFTTRQIGTGLGLPSCKNIIENHGGSIEVSSPPGKGATFEIILPRRTEWDQIPKEESEKSD